MPHAVSRQKYKTRSLPLKARDVCLTLWSWLTCCFLSWRDTVLYWFGHTRWTLSLCKWSFFIQFKSSLFPSPSWSQVFLSCTPLLLASTSLTPKRFFKNLLKFLCDHKINTCGAFVVFRGHVQSGNEFESSSTHTPSWEGTKQLSPFLCPLSRCKQVSSEMSLVLSVCWWLCCLKRYRLRVLQPCLMLVSAGGPTAIWTKD